MKLVRMSKEYQYDSPEEMIEHKNNMWQDGWLAEVEGGETTVLVNGEVKPVVNYIQDWLVVEVDSGCLKVYRNGGLVQDIRVIRGRIVGNGKLIRTFEQDTIKQIDEWLERKSEEYETSHIYTHLDLDIVD